MASGKGIPVSASLLAPAPATHVPLSTPLPINQYPLTTARTLHASPPAPPAQLLAPPPVAHAIANTTVHKTGCNAQLLGPALLLAPLPVLQSSPSRQY
jgi:hypothetical protein